MTNQKTITVLILVIIALVLSTCGPPTSNAGQPQVPPEESTPTSKPAGRERLIGTRWALVSIGKQGEETPVIEGSNVTLEFGENGQAGGSGGCNSYGSQYQAEGNTIAFREIESTLMACDNEQVTTQESSFLQALGTAGRFHLRENRLSIFYDNDQSALNFKPLGSSSTTPVHAPVISDSNLMPSGRDVKQYTLSAEAGQTIMFEITSDGAPLSLTITTPGGIERFPEVTQVGSGFRIRHNFIVSETGAYQLTLTKADQTPSTNYTATFIVQ